MKIKRADPRLCPHNVIGLIAESALEPWRCVSCDTNMTPKRLKGRKYQYSEKYHVWVEVKETHGETKAASSRRGKKPWER